MRYGQRTLPSNKEHLRSVKFIGYNPKRDGEWCRGDLLGSNQKIS